MNPPCFAWNDLRHRLPPAAPRDPLPRTRGCPYPDLAPNWTETLAFSFTVGATSQESHSSRLIYGPWRLDRVAGRVGVAATDSARLYIGVDNDDAVTETELTVKSVATREIISDSATRFIGGIDLTTLWTDFPFGTVIRRNLSRVQLLGNNTSAGAQVFVGNITITHLLPTTDHLGF